ncbi:MAG: OsmC family protein [Acidobacteriota bacterium]|mgnify:FL=1|nr:OsmC family protein [Acidobacteriota bacterium]MEC8943997.1 OsmC family protein [Acidobacteriota bacterium]
MQTTPDIKLHLDWDGELRFSGAIDDTTVHVDGSSETAPSPVQMLSTALAGCMAIDIVDILAKMRTPADSLCVDLAVERAKQTPRRVASAEMEFTILGNVPEKNVSRAIEMSRETYCSVWHSLQPDIEFQTTFKLNPS